MKKVLIDLTGRVFTRLVVIKRAPSTLSKKNKQTTRWVCSCSCNNIITTDSASLIRSKTRSCGCLQKESIRYLATTHGQSKTKAYRVWKAMWSRCTNENVQAYSSYSLRTPPDSWKSFSEFIKDMGQPPSTLHSIERINNNLPYSKNNCKWATPAEQNRNTKRTLAIVFNEETRCLKDWPKTIGIKYNVLRDRLAAGWSVERAFRTPVRKLTRKATNGNSNTHTKNTLFSASS